MLRKAATLWNLVDAKIKDRLCSKGGVGFQPRKLQQPRSEEICIIFGL